MRSAKASRTSSTPGSSTRCASSRKATGTTRWWSNFSNARARNVGWRIDYILVSAALRKSVKAAQIHADVMGSDHCPVSVTLAAGR